MSIRFAVIPLLVTLASSSIAGMHESPPPAPRVSASSVGEQHQRLSRLAGFWKVEQSLWLKPGESATVDPGVAILTMVLGGRHLRQELIVNSKVPFTGLGYTGFDNVTGQYYTSWMDLNFTDIMVLRGNYDPADHRYTFTGMQSLEVPLRGAAVVGTPVRQTLQELSPDHFVVEYFETRNGKEERVVRLDYTRS